MYRRPCLAMSSLLPPPLPSPRWWPMPHRSIPCCRLIRRYEGRIVQQMIRYAGGKGEYLEPTPPMLGIWNTLISGDFDATWVFMGWEGVEAERMCPWAEIGHGWLDVPGHAAYHSYVLWSVIHTSHGSWGLSFIGSTGREVVCRCRPAFVWNRWPTEQDTRGASLGLL